MRKLLMTVSLAAFLPAVALAQLSVPTDRPAGATEVDTTTVTPEGDDLPPASPKAPMAADVESAPAPNVPPVRSVPPSQAQPRATPGPDGVIRQWGTQQAVVENAPPAAASYPKCDAQRQDSCKNPDPSKELPYYPGEDRPGG